MAGQVQVEPIHTGAFAIVQRRPLLWFGMAALCLLSSWYFALVIAPAGLGRSAPTVVQGLYPEWLGCREILHGRDPYRAEVTQQIESAIFGSTVGASSRPANEHRFAYPIFFVFLFFPVALVPFPVAQSVALVVCSGLTAISLPLWLQPRQFTKLYILNFILLAFASYPIVLGFQLRQPSLMFAALLAAVVFWARSGRLVLAGILAGLCVSKPQLAIAVLLPLSLWSISAWRIRKAFLLSLTATLAALLLASELMVPGWLTAWLTTVRAYAHYAGVRPLLADLLRGHFVAPVAVFLICLTLWVSIQFHASDLLFTIGYSAATFQLLFPFQLYNEVLLLPAALWMAANAGTIRAHGQLHILLFGCAWTALGMGWVSMAALSLSDIVFAGSGLKLWQLPLAAVWVYPWAVWVAFTTFAISSSRNIPQTKLLQRTMA